MTSPASHPTGTESHSRSLVIQPNQGLERLVDLWRFRELFLFLVWRDIKVQYKQSVFGFGWAIFQPLVTMLVFTFVFGRMAKVPSEGYPYAIFSYAGLLPWTFMARGSAEGAASLVAAAGVVSKVYFPRLLVPGAKVLQSIVDLGVSLLIYFLLMAVYGIAPTPALAALPLFILLAIFTTLGVAILLSALNVQYRDVKHVTPFFVQIWLFLTPVIFPTSRAVALLETHGLPGWMYGLNPAAGVVEGFRWSLLGLQSPRIDVIVASVVVSVALFVVAMTYFRSVERGFADVL